MASRAAISAGALFMSMCAEAVRSGTPCSKLSGTKPRITLMFGSGKRVLDELEQVGAMLGHRVVRHGGIVLEEVVQEDLPAAQVDDVGHDPAGRPLVGSALDEAP